MRDQSYAGDDGDNIQQPGEDTPETVTEIRRNNAARRGYCKRN